MVEHEPRKKPSDFGGNQDHVTLGLELRDMFYLAVVSK